MVNSSHKEEAGRTALRVSVYNWRTRTESSCGTPQIWRIFHQDSRDTESKAAANSIKAMYADLLNSFDFSMIWRIEIICSVVIRPTVTPACSLRRWLWKVRSKRIFANSFPRMESRVMPRWFSKCKNDSTSPIIRDGFLDPYNADYVRLQWWSRCQGVVDFWDAKRDLYFTVCDWVSVQVRIRCCLFSITLVFDVCCITWLVEQIIEVIFPSTQAIFDTSRLPGFARDSCSNIISITAFYF